MIKRSTIKLVNYAHPKKLSFECNINKKRYSKVTDIDEWGSAFVWVEDSPYGVEYNFCKQEGDDCSAIYLIAYSKENETYDVQYDVFNGYEIDFSKRNWKDNLENAMIDNILDLIEMYNHK